MLELISVICRIFDFSPSNTECIRTKMSITHITRTNSKMNKFCRDQKISKDQKKEKEVCLQGLKTKYFLQGLKAKSGIFA